jgi:hypothetical protein
MLAEHAFAPIGNGLLTINTLQLMRAILAHFTAEA